MKFARTLRLITAAALLAASGAAFAADPTPEQIAAAKAVMKSLNVSEGFDNILPAVAQQAKTQFVARDPSNANLIEQTVEKVALDLAKTRPDLDNAIASAWAARYSIDEMKQIAAFFNSPLGVKLQQYQPAISKDTMTAAHNWEQSIAVKLQQDVITQLEKPAK